MGETNKEYKYRVLVMEIIDYIERMTDYFEDLCDCELEEGNHQDLCKTTMLRLDFDEFEKKCAKIRIGEE